MRTVTVVPFDALLSPALTRHAILLRTLKTHGIDPYLESATRVVRTMGHGRTAYEFLHAGWGTHERLQRDPTLLELLALDADRAYVRWLRDGASLVLEPSTLMDRYTQQGTRRVIVRADARRRDVIPFLERCGLHDALSMIRCADDPPIAASIARSSFCRSWEAIIDRLTRWGVDRAQVDVQEQEALTQMVAQQLLSGACVTELGY